MNFSDRLAKQILKKKNPSVLGLDPRLEYIPESIKTKAFNKYSCPLRQQVKVFLNLT